MGEENYKYFVNI